MNGTEKIEWYPSLLPIRRMWHSKKMNNSRGFYMNDEGRVVDEQYRRQHLHISSASLFML